MVKSAIDRRLLISADWHYGLYKNLCDQDFDMLTSQAREIDKSIERIQEYGRENDIKTLIVLGDITHRRNLRPDAVNNLIDKRFRELEKVFSDIYLLVGNHDQADTKGSVDSITRLESDITTVISKPAIINVLGWQWLFVPYMEHNLAEAAVDSLLDNYSKQLPKILAGHLGVSGATTSGFEYKVREPVTLQGLSIEEFVFAFFGHYHKPQDLSSSAMYVGAPCQHSFKDAEDERGFWEIELVSKNGTYSVKRNFIHNAEAPTFHEIDVKDYSPEKFPQNSYIRLLNASVEDREKYRGDSRIYDIIGDTEEVEHEEIIVSVGDGWDKWIDTWVEQECNDKRKQRQLKSIGKEVKNEVEV